MSETKKTVRLAIVSVMSMMLSGCMNTERVKDGAEVAVGATLGTIGAFAVVGAIGAFMATPSKAKPIEVRVVK